MRVNEGNVSIYVGNDEVASRTNSPKNKGNYDIDNKSINARDLRIVPDNMEEKKLNAQKKAWKIVSEANTKENMVDENISNMQKKIEGWKQSSQTLQKEIDQIHDNIDQLKEEYGVSDDSQEQKDLELLMKQQAKIQGDTGIELTKEESDRLASMGELTDYQTRALGYSESLHIKSEEIKQNNEQIKNVNTTINGIKVDRCKSHAMVDAIVESDQLLETISKEIAGQLITEAKEEIDHNIDQMEEEASKDAKEKEVEEEKKEKAKELKETNGAQNGEEVSSHQANSSQGTGAVEVTLETDVMQVQRKISKILKEENLLEEDLKGIVLDTNL